MCEPVELDRLPVCLRRVCRDDIQVCCHLLKFCLAHRVAALFSLCFQKLLISLFECHDCIAVDEHGLEFILLLDCLGIVHEVDRVDGSLYLLFIFSVSLCEYVLSSASMARASLLHEFSEHAGRITFLPLVCHPGDDLVSHGLALPERYDDLLLVLDILLRHGIVDDSTVIHYIHVFDSVACELRECR